MSSGKKTKRCKKSNSAVAGRVTSRPPPPPPPPSSLVKLLKSDKSVVTYFKSLQDNLDADVQVWKNRAQTWEKANYDLKAELAQEKKRHRSSKKAATDPQNVAAAWEASSESSAAGGGQKKEDSHDDEILKKDTLRELSEPAVGVPIDDALFDSMDDDSSKSSSSNTTSCIAAAEDIQSFQHIFSLLCEAYDSLVSLGIELVDATTTELATDQNFVEPDFGFGEQTDELALPEKVVAARSDESVMLDILDQIANTRLIPKVMKDTGAAGDTAISQDFALVGSDHNMMLACNPGAEDSTAPPLLCIGKRLLLRALTILDTFCSPCVLQDEWDAYFTHSTDHFRGISVGLRSRKNLVDKLLRFVDDSIQERWSHRDRAVRLASTALHFHDKQGALDSKYNDSDLKSSIILGDVSSRSRLGLQVERSTLCQVATAMHLFRKEKETAISNVWQYVVSTVPSHATEEYPMLPPIMSMVCFEGLLLLSDSALTEYDRSSCIVCNENVPSSWFSSEICGRSAEGDNNIARTVSYAIHSAASIWFERLKSPDDRIHDVAAIQIASYRRLLRSEVSWLYVVADNENGPTPYNDSVLHTYMTTFLREEKTHNLLDDFLGSANIHTESAEDQCVSLVVALIAHGNLSILNTLVGKTISTSDVDSLHVRKILDVVTSAMRHLVVREVEFHRKQIGIATGDLLCIQDFSGTYEAILKYAGKLPAAECIPLLSVALECAAKLADGSSAFRIVQRLICEQFQTIETDDPAFDMLARTLYEAVHRTSRIPVVRVINLQRRKDRMKAFVSQAMREGISIVKAVTGAPKQTNGTQCDGQPPIVHQDIKETSEFGLYAIDGLGRLVEASGRLVDEVGSIEKLNNIVGTHWRPNDLKPFDRDAPDAETLARMTPSERACALSHYYSWKGVHHSLNTFTDTERNLTLTTKVFRYPEDIQRLFKVSGFAEGPALLAKNDTMPPTPVCVILEDDAILVDRFSEKLGALLKELPRDFHFCSIGYSRPKSAPIVPYNDQIGIPSMLWYLTGYCLSERGADYLLNSLPIIGPVDSFIGLKMTNNWDNIFGERLGVGVHSQPNSEIPAHKDLCRILNFRAFCALTPLCTQKVRVDTAAGTVATASSGRNWRQRDTDIEYSGDLSRAASQK